MQAVSTGTTIVASKNDPASYNIFQNLIRHQAFNPETSTEKTPIVYKTRDLNLVLVESEAIYVQPEQLPVVGASVVFASKHRSSTNTPALTVHATGNLTSEALYGGNPEEISFVEPFRIRQALKALIDATRESGFRIDVTMEATHHGPTNFAVPVCFVEIGSTQEQWTDPRLGQIVAGAIMAASRHPEDRKTNAVGFGGTHYSDKLTRMCAQSDYQIGHIVPRHAFDHQVSHPTILETFHKTAGLCKTAIVDWKGLKSEQRRSLLDRLSAWDIEIVRC